MTDRVAGAVTDARAVHKLAQSANDRIQQGYFAKDIQISILLPSKGKVGQISAVAEERTATAVMDCEARDKPGADLVCQGGGNLSGTKRAGSGLTRIPTKRGRPFEWTPEFRRRSTSSLLAATISAVPIGFDDNHGYRHLARINAPRLAPFPPQWAVLSDQFGDHF